MNVMKRALQVTTGLVVFALMFLFLFATLGGLSTSLPGAWLPVGLGVVITVLLVRVPSLRDSWLRLVSGLLYSFGVLALWIRSEPLLGYNQWVWGIQMGSRILQGAMALLLVVILAILWRRKPSDRPPTVPFFALFLFGWLVAFFSGGAGGSDPMIDRVMEWLNVNQAVAEMIVIAIRKTIHFSFYGLLALSAYRLAALGSERRAAVWFALLVALSHAVYDETRQAMTPGRTGTPLDVMLDMAGAGAFVWLASRRRLRDEVLLEAQARS